MLFPSSYRPGRARRRGFSMVEALVSATVLATVGVAAVATQLSAQDLLAEARENNLATELLESTMDRVAVLSVDDILAGSTEYQIDSTVPCASGGGGHLLGQTILLTSPGYTPGDPRPDVLPLQLDLAWVTSTGQPRSLSLSMLKR